MKDFNWDNFKKDEIAVHCSSIEKAKDFLSKCKGKGLKWYSGHDLDNYNYWDKYKVDTVYNCWGNIQRIEFGELSNYLEEGYKIIEWEIDKVMNKEFTKLDLKSGMIVEYKNGSRRVVVGETLVGEYCQNLLAYYSDDLKIMKSNELDATHDSLDIMKVFKVQKGMYCMPQFLYQIPDSEVIWKREEPKKMTIEQIEKALGYKIEIED